MDISKVTDYLYVSSKLQAGHLEELPARNIQMAISMIVGQQPPDHPSFRILWLQTCDSILIPIPMKELMNGVQAALPIIQGGQSVLVYCAKGRHRSVAMAAAILIAMGYTAREAINLLLLQRPVADPQAWHISQRIRRFEIHWQDKGNPSTNTIRRIHESYSETATALVSQIILTITKMKQND